VFLLKKKKLAIILNFTLTIFYVKFSTKQNRFADIFPPCPILSSLLVRVGHCIQNKCHVPSFGGSHSRDIELLVFRKTRGTDVGYRIVSHIGFGARFGHSVDRVSRTLLFDSANISVTN
jgi:hypothetical protein